MTSTATRHSHPLFARFYARIAAYGEAKGAAEHRDRLLAGLSGRVVEVGAGNGMNFGHYPASVGEVVAVEPEPYLRRRATAAAQTAPVPVRVVEGTAAELPLEDASMDAGVVSLVLCSVPSQAAALAELRRVIRPGGQLRCYEHVRSADAGLARLQDRLDVVWAQVGGGCHCNRDTEASLAAAGFVVEAMQRFDFRPSVLAALTAPVILGRARRP